MSEKLPKGWVKATLREVNVPSRTRVLPSEAPDLPYVGMEHVESKTMKLLGHSKASSLKSSSGRFNTGDILYGKMRPYLNKVWLAEFDGLCSAEFLVFPKVDGLDSKLFAYRLNSQDFVDFANHQVSGERPRVSFEKLAKFSFRLAPAREQERIVAKLDALLSRVTAGETTARRAHNRLHSYRAAVLQAAVTGELTREWREIHHPEETGADLLERLLVERRARWEEVGLKRSLATGKLQDENWKRRYPEPASPIVVNNHNLPETWAWASPEQLSDGMKNALSIGPFGSNLKVSDYRSAGVPLIFVRNIRSEDFSGDGGKYVSPKKADELAAHQVVGGDLLITEMGDPPGDACVYPNGAPTAIITADCIRVHPPDTLHHTKQFFVHCINSMLGRDQFQRITSGIAQQKVSLARFASIALPLPPLAEQAEINRIIELRLSAADKLAATLDRQLERAQFTRQSLLREAFAGNLVPQNPNDEPASALLEKVRAIREAEVKKPKVKRMPKAELTFATRKLFDLIKEKFGGGAFTFEDLRKEDDETEYDALRNQLYELLRPNANDAAPVLQMSFDTKNEVMEFKMQSS